jgi:hypothetical protein
MDLCAGIITVTEHANPDILITTFVNFNGLLFFTSLGLGLGLGILRM